MSFGTDFLQLWVFCMITSIWLLRQSFSDVNLNKVYVHILRYTYLGTLRCLERGDTDDVDRSAFLPESTEKNSTRDDGALIKLVELDITPWFRSSAIFEAL